MSNKIVIYNETPKDLTNKDVILAVLEVIKQEPDGNYSGPYKVFDCVVVTFIQNKQSITFRVARCINR